jgi:DNA-binding FadR family transcriptional regulator
VSGIADNKLDVTTKATAQVGSRPRRGTEVRPVSDWNLLDSDVLRWLRETPPDGRIVIELPELRFGFEPAAAALAARRADATQLARIGEAYGFMRKSEAGNNDPVEADCRFHESIIAATNNRFYPPLRALVGTALSLTAPITNAIFGHAVGDLAAHGEVLLAIERKDERRAFDLMRGLLSDVARKVAEANTCPGVPIIDRHRSKKVSAACDSRISDVPSLGGCVANAFHGRLI